MCGESHNPARIFLITGPPGCGKTTLVRRLVDSLSGRRVAGFLTEEIRESGKRQGFMARAFDGRACVLAHRRISSSRRVGPYGVDTATFEREIVTSLQNASQPDVFIIDEVGKMELKSDIFAAVVQQLVDGERPLLATIPVSPLPLIKRLLNRPDSLVAHMDASRRSAVAVELVNWCFNWGLCPAANLSWATSY